MAEHQTLTMGQTHREVQVGVGFEFVLYQLRGRERGKRERERERERGREEGRKGGGGETVQETYSRKQK